MPQGRIILKSISQSRKMSELKTDGARLLYTWLIPNLDIKGRFSGDEDVIKGQIFTRLKKTVKQIGEYLQDLADVGLIVWYESDNDKYLQVPDFVDKQPSLNPNKEAESTIPEPTPDQLQSSSVPTPPKGKGREVKGSLSKAKSKAFQEYWNSKKRLPKIKAFSKSRQDKLKARLNEDFFEQNWKMVIDKLDASDFCCGLNDRQWKVDCTWILSNSDNYVKVMEGKYDNKGQQPTRDIAKILALAEEMKGEQ